MFALGNPGQKLVGTVHSAKGIETALQKILKPR